MWIFKAAFYLIAAAAVVTAVTAGAMALALIGILFGILLDLVGAVLFTAAALQAYFGRHK